MISKEVNLMTNLVQVPGPNCQTLPFPILQKLEGFEKQLRPGSNLYPKDFSFGTKIGQNLTDLERLSLALLTLFRVTAGEVFLLWELRMWTIEQSSKNRDALSCFILSCNNYYIATESLLLLSPRWEIFLQRNFPQNLHSAFRKLKLVFTNSGPVTKIQRKRGYTDGRGNFDPYDVSRNARLDARAYWLDLVQEQKDLTSKKDFSDMVALITGFLT